ncbi:MAG: 5-formyltetrahydrofolate cyclo-ligase [Planctomycetota bacterium]|jgi:5-formyltetrahydrofolate cyclo-ligase
MDKVELRRQLRNCLLSLPQEQRESKSRNACRNLATTAQFQAASTVMMYLSLPHEVDTAEAILQAWQMGKVVAVPKISWQQRHMLPVVINSLETGFTTGVGGLRNPTSGTPVSFEEIDLVVSPALGFDRRGNRLGRGGAFYDRLFANNELTASRCGLAFTEQVVDSIPVADHDEPVHFLVTDEGVISCDQKKGA